MRIYCSYGKTNLRTKGSNQNTSYILSRDRSTSHLAITWQDIDLLTSINAFLTPPDDLTDTLSGETLITISAVKPML